MKKLCCLFNYAPHYRTRIYQLMGQELHCDFYFGRDLREKLEKMDYTLLKGFKGELKNIYMGNWVWRKGLIRLAFRKEYDTFMISGEPHTLSLIPFNLICLLLGKKVYSWQHGITNVNIGRIKLFNQKVLLSMQAGVFLYSNHARENMIHLGYDPDKLHVIYNSLEYDQALQYRETATKSLFYKDKFANDDPVLLFIGRLTTVKKIHMLIEAFLHLNQDKNTACNLVVIGDGPVKNELQKTVDTSGLSDRCWFTGALYDEKEIAGFLYNADVCVSPGNVGLTAIHAFSYGLPVITNDNFSKQMPEFEIIDAGKTGMFFKENDQQSLELVIKEWLFENLFTRNTIRRYCFEKIDNYYNPYTQIQILKDILDKN